MKKILVWLLVLMLSVSPLAALCEGEEEKAPDTLVVANPTHMNGNFFSSMWGNVTSDLDVQRLIHGYNLVMWDHTGSVYREDDSVVAGVLRTANADGDIVYLLPLYDDLYFSDGTQITAWDYAFSFLFEIAPQVVEIGGTPLRLEYLKGYSEYVSGASKALSGVRVLDDQTLQITLDHNYLPFFYEMGLMYCNPIPIRVIAPGCKVYDDGEGVYIASENDPADGGAFNGELLRKTVLDPENGYLSHPSVVSGPYMLTGFDGTTATFEINPYFKGTADGTKPSIQKLVYTLGDNDTMIEQLKNGELGLLNKVTYQEAIQAGMMSGFRMQSYPRTGLSYISFLGESVPVQSQSVRQAMAYCMMKDEIVNGYGGQFALRVDGYYGMGQWMYGLVSGTIAPPVQEGDEEAKAAWESLSLNGLETYETGSQETDIQEAIRLLEEDGWTLQEGNTVRSKEIGGSKYTLSLRMLYPRGNHVADLMEKFFVEPLAQAGIALELVPMENEELLSTYYHQRDRSGYDMIYLGTNFHPVFDPSVSFMTSSIIANWPNWNNSESRNQELYEKTVDLRQTQPGAVLDYVRNWIRFQEVFSKVLPIIPIYSNIYFDFFTPELTNYHADANVTWAEAIVEARLGAAEEEANETDDADAAAVFE